MVARRAFTIDQLRVWVRSLPVLNGCSVRGAFGYINFYQFGHRRPHKRARRSSYRLCACLPGSAQFLAATIDTWGRILYCSRYPSPAFVSAAKARPVLLAADPAGRADRRLSNGGHAPASFPTYALVSALTQCDALSNATHIVTKTSFTLVPSPANTRFGAWSR